jgi:hypothetical protein
MRNQLRTKSKAYRTPVLRDAGFQDIDVVSTTSKTCLSITISLTHRTQYPQITIANTHFNELTDALEKVI